jgi:putative membrane protein
MTTLTGFLQFVLYLSFGVALLSLFTRLYLIVTPYHEETEIAEGKMAPAIALCGAMLGFTFPLLVASYSHQDFIGFLLWSVIACIVQLAAFWVLYTLLPRYIEANNTAGASCFAAASICVGLINAASFIP